MLSDISQSWKHMLPMRYDACPCVTPRAQILIRRYGDLHRSIIAREALMLQGMPFKSETGGLSQASQMLLAGNAFCTVEAMAAMFQHFWSPILVKKEFLDFFA